VRFLVDAQLPPDLAGFLTSCGYEARHVSEIGLLSAGDAQIWKHAQSGGFVIVTKDADFAVMSALRGAPPQIVWLRFGNTRKTELRERLAALLPRIVAAFHAGERLVEVV
jgi:predicted nuclease of predicted toxin-antitoxin system